MNIDLVWYFDKAKWVFPFWRDGVRAAMEEIERRGHTVRYHLGLDVDIPEDSDFILNWDNSTSEFIPQMREYPQRKGLILTTDLGLNVGALRNYDVIFPEAEAVTKQIKPHGIRCITAFGTDTDFFRPEKQTKYYKAFYPSTFSPWKRQDRFADKYGSGGLCLGTIQPDGQNIYDYVKQVGTETIVGYLPVELVRDLYNMSEVVDITGWEGSGRTVLEALSCDLSVFASEDNHKCQEYIKNWENSNMSPREYVIRNYSHVQYADKILKGAIDA